MVGVAAEPRLPGVLRRTVESACALSGAGYGMLAQILSGDRLGKLTESGGERVYRRAGELPSGPGALVVPVGGYGRLCLIGEFTAAHREAVTVLADAASAAIRNADRYEHALRRERWREASQEVTAALLRGEDGVSTLHTIADEARAVAGASGGAIALPDESDPEALVFEVVASPHREYQSMLGATVPTHGTASGEAYTTGKPVVVSGYGGHVAIQQANSGLELPSTLDDLDSAVAVPLVAGEDRLGVLLVVRFREADPFTEAEVELVRDFAAHAALALEFASAERDRQRLAQFEERDRVGQDLHDLVIQRLFAIGLGLEGLGRATGQPELAERVSGFVRDLDRTIRDVRNAIFSLQEPGHAGGGVRSDLLRMAQDSAGMLGFEPRISFDGPLDAAVTGTVRLDLLATVREALSAVARRASARSASVEVLVDRDGRLLTLTVADDGDGSPDALAPLRRRAAKWRGTLEVGSLDEGGTKLVWTAVLGG
ncbi:GAF domain-containing protein [Amycolatopsis alkalitolerans]|uniref:GAF domain-containing protein n=1 Tax=Amycolatopsis alkalitolerans TaxID=2547244 RepID=A0A5C4LQ27_9PSEU|nr:GAF domain-containing protein [Amycolatopsis alkalitolerans]